MIIPGFRKTVSHGLTSLPLPARPARGKAAGAGLEMEPGGWSGAVLRQLQCREQSGSRANPADQRGLGLSPGPGADSSPRTLLPPSHCRLCQVVVVFFFSKRFVQLSRFPLCVKMQFHLGSFSPPPAPFYFMKTWTAGKLERWLAREQ